MNKSQIREYKEHVKQVRANVWKPESITAETNRINQEQGWLEKDRFAMYIFIWNLALYAIIAALALAAIKVVDRIHRPVESKRVIADTIGAAREYETKISGGNIK